MTDYDLRRILTLIKVKVKEVKGGLLTNKALAEVLEQLVKEVDDSSDDIILPPNPEVPSYLYTDPQGNLSWQVVDIPDDYYTRTESDGRYIYASPTAAQDANIRLSGNISANVVAFNNTSAGALDWATGYSTGVTEFASTAALRLSGTDAIRDYWFKNNDNGSLTLRHKTATGAGISFQETNIYDTDGVKFLKQGDAYPLNGNPLGFLTSYTEIDPTVPNYSKSLTSFNVIKDATDDLYYPRLGNPSGFLTSAPVTSVFGRTGTVVGDVADYSAFYNPILYSGTNIKTLNGESILGSGDITTSTISNYVTTDSDQFSIDGYKYWNNDNVFNAQVQVYGDLGASYTRLGLTRINGRKSGGGFEPALIIDAYGSNINESPTSLSIGADDAGFDGIVSYAKKLSDGRSHLSWKVRKTTSTNIADFGGTLVQTALTADRNWVLPNKNGTIALLDDIIAITNYVDLTTNQTIGGNKNFTGTTKTDGIFATYVNTNASGSNVYTQMSNTQFQFTNGASTLALSAPVVTGVRTQTFQNKNGIVSLLSDLDNYVDKTTNQTIGGVKTFSNTVFGDLGFFGRDAITLADSNNFSLAVLNSISGGSLTKGQLSLFNKTTGNPTIGLNLLPPTLTTVDRTQTFQDKDGVVALLSDLGSYLTTNTYQTGISAAKVWGNFDDNGFTSIAQGQIQIQGLGGRGIVMDGSDIYQSTTTGASVLLPPIAPSGQEALVFGSRLPAATGTLALTKSAFDFEITDATKGVILTSPNGNKWRQTISDTGLPTYTQI